MKLTVNRPALADAMAWTALAVAKRPSFPALAGVRLTATKAAGGGTLTLEAYDFDTGHTATVDAKVSEAGTALVSGHMAASLVGALRTAEVDISIEDGRLILKAGRSRYTLNQFALDDFPTLPVTKAEPAGTVEADELRRMLGLVAYAVDDNSPTQRLKGVRLQADGSELVTLGMRSSSIAAAWTPFPGALAVWLPLGPLEAAVRGLEGPVALAADDGTLVLSTAARTVTLRLYAADPVDWSGFLPGETSVALTIDADELRGAVKRAGLTCAHDEALTLTMAPGELTIRAGAADTAESIEVVDAEVEGKLVVSFGGILAKALAKVPEGPVYIKARTEPRKPVTITNDDDDFIVVVMPRRA